ncbi:LmeA family phospholipid-binding protein [Geodermatophilus marinus]|uniref:LmeA family phospholipid-binding protein n=1 Tax=Geodermatophilus sp. LHW52908 TaxID=2303986 RepID=UPI000E3CB521|nr:DUF2993 domain-containing protein [Geodermatophilus sp. LHW52908]RFU23513.1 DUF2993 domain-containing protein [Geodermatophilus sp. LHW52908]
MRALVVVLLGLAGLAVLGDRLAEWVAERQVAQVVAERGGLPATPDVEIGGFPFLTQALGGRYDDVRVVVRSADVGPGEVTGIDVTLRGVQVPLSDVLGGVVQEVPVERVDGTATLSYDLLSDELGEGTTLEQEGDGLRITRTVELAGQELPLTAVGTVSLDGDELVVDVDEASGAGVDLPRVLVNRAGDLLDLRYPIEALPFGLELTGVRPAADGVVVTVVATDTVLSG